MNKKSEYKGLYIQDKEQPLTYYEYGAHFSYKALYDCLELILKNNNKNTKANNTNIIQNLKKSNSQKILCDKNNKERKINFSRNSKKIHNNAGNKIINNDKLYKSKSINQRIELSKSFNDDLYGSFSLYSKNNSKNKSCKKNNYKEIKKREILIKKNSENTKKNNILLLNNNNSKNKLKHKHTVLKYVKLPKKHNISKIISENYYGLSLNNKNINDNNLSSYCNDLSFNSTGNKYNNKNKDFYHKIYYSTKNKKFKISSITNKKYSQKLISDSPNNNLSSIFINNTSGYYSQKTKTQKLLDNNLSNFSLKSKHNDSDVEFENKNDFDNNNNYYIENDNFKNYKGNYSNIMHKNLLLNNNSKQKNKKVSIFNNFNKINFQKNTKVNYLDNFKNSILLCEKMKSSNFKKNSTIKLNNPKLKSNIIYSTTKENFIEKSYSNSFIKTNKISNKSINIYNITSGNKNKITKKHPIKNHNSHINISKTNKNKNKKNIPHINNKNLDSFTFHIEGENSCSRNKKSRNNNSKNIVNLLCCHFSINFNSPINILNNIQNNIYNNNSNIISKTPKISNRNVSDFNDDIVQIENNAENINLNNINRSRNNKSGIISGNKSIEDINKDKVKKKNKIHINKKESNKIPNKLNTLNKKEYNIMAKKKKEYNKIKINLSKKK